MPIIARLLWICAAILLVMAIVTSTLQNEDTAENTSPPTNQQLLAGDGSLPQPDAAHNSRPDGYSHLPDRPTNSSNAIDSDHTRLINELNAIIPMSVKEAYKAIPHIQNTYRASAARIATNDAVYLERFFSLTDRMTAARVAALTRLYYGYGGMTIAQYNKAYELAVDEGLNQLVPPHKAKAAHQLVIEALAQQRKFLNHWANASQIESQRLKQTYGRNPDVVSSSEKLKKAYAILMQAYDKDAPNNKRSFYDHLCALDFI